jgi:hypothetical protein
MMNGKVSRMCEPGSMKVEDYRSSTNYRAEVTHVDAILEAWSRATGERKTYLRQFITIDMGEMNAEARRLKDPKKMMKQLPGVRAWSR